MKHKEFYNEIKALHAKIVKEIISLMKRHGVDEVDLLGSNADHAYVCGYPNDDADVMAMEVSKVVLDDGKLMLDVILDIDTDELAEQNEDGDIGAAYQSFPATDHLCIIACAGIELVYESVYQVLEQGK